MGLAPYPGTSLLSGLQLGSLAMAFVQGWATISQVREGAQALLLVTFKTVDNRGWIHPKQDHVMWGWG